MSRWRMAALGAAGFGATAYVLLPSRFKPRRQRETDNVMSINSAEPGDSGGGGNMLGEIEALMADLLQWSLFKVDHGVGFLTSSVKKPDIFVKSSRMNERQRRTFPASYFWRITPPHKGVPSYLFGTIHLPQLFPYLPSNIKEATQLSDVFAFEADPNARMMQLLKEGFKKQGRLPKFVENANAILDINIYNIATSRRKPIFGLEKLEENEEYAKEIDQVEQATEPSGKNAQSNHNQPNRLLNCYINGTFPTSMEDWLQKAEANNPSLLELHKKLQLLRNKKMAAEMHRLLTGNPNAVHFFAVGVSHLNMPPTIQQFLESLGYVFERIPPGTSLNASK